MKARVLTALTSLSLGATGGALVSDLTSEAIASTHRVRVNEVVANDAPEVQALWSSVDALLCRKAESASGLPAGSCAIEPGTVACATRSAADTDVTVRFAFRGKHVPE